MNSRTARRFYLLLAGVGCLLLAAVTAAASVPTLFKWRDLSQLQEQGETVIATVTGSDVDLSGRFAKDIIYYEYQPRENPTPYRSEIRLDRRGAMADIMQLISHRELKVRYLPSKPATHCLEIRLADEARDAKINSIGYLVAAIGAGIAGLVLTGFSVPWKRIRRR